ncbi:GAF domain-containing protein [Azospirillum sp.]|uniref:GAF domain-containing protein n=1 Tax=Azospirillum sp. TaxID=34012 RepID=UPI002D265E62|nr:GAF domain-containing protein [Azospirillum sp.]HYD65433.1 GAF domain-containing protein [Azospirillum sp.]
MKDTLTIDAIRNCLEGVIPAAIATCDPDGTPNVSLLSQVHYVDGAHVALSYQFFNKTRRNILAHPFATVQVIDPATVAQYRLHLRYLHTETGGPLFESMKAKLSGIASHAGMQGVFRLMGADLYRVERIEEVPGTTLPPPVGRRSLLPVVRRSCERLAACADLCELLDTALAALKDDFGIEHALVLMADEAAGRLYTVAAMGHAVSGVGSEVALGDGVIGVAARERTPIRITHMTSEYSYSQAVRASATDAGVAFAAREIPFPGLAEPHSQLAVPILAGPRLAGVLFVESPQELRFCYDDEDALATLAAQMGAMMAALPQAAAPAEEAPAGGAVAAGGGAAAVIRHYAADDSVFIDHDYLIKGVAGAIFWKLARDYVHHGRTDFTNRELRLAPDIPLPYFAENLEARLILLQRRLAERCAFLGIEKTGRGRFRLAVQRPLALEEMV